MANQKQTTNLPAVANSIRELFNKEGVIQQLKTALPQQTDLTPENLIRTALTVIRTNPKLLECSQQSLLACLMGCGQLGLRPDLFLGQVYFVPYYSKKTQMHEAQLIPGYRGYITLARKSGELSTISADVVFENDEFEIRKGIEEDLLHVPNYKGERGQVIGAYCVFRYHSGSATFDFMSIEEIEAIRKRSKSPDIGPWKTDYNEMAKKTVIRRHIKLVPLSIEDNNLARAAHAENLALDGGQGDFFIGSDEPVDIGDTEKPEKSKMEYIEKFDMATAHVQGSKLDAFLVTVAENNGITVQAVKTEACENLNAFFDAFNEWKTGKDQEQTQPDPDKAFIDEWFRLQKGDMKKSGFHAYVILNRHKFENCSEKTFEMASKKYRKLYGADFPERSVQGEGSTKGETENSSQIGSQGVETDENLAALMQTDEWNELSMLIERYPGKYNTVKKNIGFEGKQIRSVDHINALIREFERITGDPEKDIQF